MATIDVSLQRQSLLRDAATLQFLPRELVLIIQDHTHSSQLLEAIATAALIAPVTDRIFAHFDSCFADICARWVLSHPKLDVKVFSSFARILPFAPALSVFFTSHLQDGGAGGVRMGQQIFDHLDLTSFSDVDLPVILLALWRLNNLDKRTYSPLSSPSQLQSLFTTHANPAVRCLAIRIFCQLHDASDQKLEALFTKYAAKDTSLIADLDGRRVDYSFLSLYEDARSQEVHRLRNSIQAEQQQNEEPVTPVIQNLTPLVVTYGKTVLPRPLGPVNTPSTLALTSTTVENLENLSSLLQQPGPILLHGLSGAGKTSLVQEVARELGKQSEMVTLHLNEQTDAKMLLGLYTTDEKPGSFSWRPGVLTTAVKEGRWVLIEDLDRAPTEVMSTLLPLIERGELLIPGRGERIQATNGFRMFATVRTLMGMNDKENLPNMIGQRLWQLLHVKALPRDDLREVIVGRYPLLHKYTVGILAVFDTLIASTSGSSRLSLGRTVLDRPIGTRDLLKWCGRLDDILRSAGVKTGEEPITDTTRDRMFLEAVDCFVSNIHEIAARNLLIQAIAKEMHLSPERVQHYLSHYIPDMADSESRLTIGRASFVKSRRSSRIAKSKRPFATTVHAKRLLEQISVAVKHREPLLLVGETGIGKTTVVQQLAESLGHQLVAVNLSQQSEASDLLGGFKPVSAQSLAMPLKEEFEDLLEKTGVSAEKNREYLDRIAKRFVKGKWREVSKEWRKAPKMFEAILEKLESSQAQAEPAEEQPAKRRKTGSTKLQRLRDLRPRWDTFSQSLDQFDRQVASGPGGFAFAFVEGKIVKAARNGDWILLDEINLASPDTLESIAGLFQTTPSLLLSETGEIERIQAHPNFRVFGAMNPATDVGKRDLPLGLRSRFTEIYVQSPDRDKKDLLTIIKTYLKGNNSTIDRLADEVADLYLEIKRRAEAKQLVDQANEVPHFSLRTLTRVLTYANDVAPVYGLDRALYEGFCMCFTTLLSEESEQTVRPLIHQHLLKKSNILTQPPKRPLDGKNYISFKNRDKNHEYFLLQGNHEPIVRDDYIITRYVERNLLNLVRATSTRRYPILIQGPTSAGKTSMIEYLANYTGNKFVRINNHEHTDLQEYLGTYVSDSEGKLKFQEGILVQAMREGSWIVLDELNLAPTDVLEALNRLLDDNRELLIPETQEIVRPAENFCLFATQNPPGLYGGRKVLSRAFRNRFLELHFDDIPESELKEILQQRSKNTAPSDCGRIVNVYKQLTRLRQESRVFEQKNSFATLRDLFRWALRESETRQEIAEHGYMLLAERVRKPEERDEVRKVIEQEFKVQIDSQKLYDLDTAPELRNVKARNSQGVIWTKAMRRLYVLVKRAIKNNEPVLLVGETGCGKTTVVQLLAEFEGQGLHIVNAHQNTETGDLIGSQRPVRNRGAIVDALFRDLEEVAGLLGREKVPLEELQEWYRTLPVEELAKVPEALKAKIHAGITRSKALFEWSDGSLVHAMREGSYFLLDEISLADDSVLERLNSVLEPQRTLLLAEKGVDDSFVQGSEGFQFFATMNPGGDFGKKELSPALRNRFTEIWVPAFSEVDDVHDIVVSKLDKRFKQTRNSKSKPVSRIIVEFAYWFGKTFRPSSATAFSVRDILSWVQFMNTCPFKSTDLALLHGAAMVFIDTIGANPSALISVDPKEMASQRQQCLEQLGALCGKDLTQPYFQEPELKITPETLSIGDFSVKRSAAAKPDTGDEFAVPTTKMNAMRVIRALQGTKPILLEGNPGVGKTTLITALARACGMPLTRINLSDQTDLMDLFGTDVPVEGAEAGNFVWQNAPFLEAMQKGEWVLLDEMNLASQTVLEGLNACLDHRGEVYIAELDQVFKRHPDFKLFAAQNPHHQGGGRKGLPSSFVNRFIVVYSDVFTKEDLLHITAKKFAKIGEDTRHRLIEFMSKLDDEVVGRRSFGALGSPWEFNLRDTLRWGDLLTSDNALLANRKPDDYLDVIIRQRFRSERDREAVNKLFAEIFERVPEQHGLYHDINPYFCQVGLATIKRNALSQPTKFPPIDPVVRLKEIESILISIEQDLPCILVGPSGSGKSALLAHVAALAGKPMVIFPLNADVDAMDLIGGFEQADPHREVQASLSKFRQALQDQILSTLPNEVAGVALDVLSALGSFTGETYQYEGLLPLIESLQIDPAVNRELATLLDQAKEALHKPLTLENPRFEWLDGVIVRAVETGAWLVLDNANLCSASVLDRLNSLLERPNGILSINEHSGPGGEPRIIKPHPDFRIFLTVDPRYGELSRAMRNRSVEIYLDTLPPGITAVNQIAPVDGSLQRFHTAAKLASQGAEEGQLIPLAFDVLFLGDSNRLDAYINIIREALSDGCPSLIQSPEILQHLDLLLSYIHHEDAGELRQAIVALYAPSPDKMLMPLHPLINSPMLPLLDQARGGLTCWLAACYELFLDIQKSEKAMAGQLSKVNVSKPSSLNRLQRSFVADKVASLAKDSTVNCVRFLSSVVKAIKGYISSNTAEAGNWKQRRAILRRVMLFWKRTFEFLVQSQFEEARFQSHLTQGANLLQRNIAEVGQDEGIQKLLLSVGEYLERDFVVGFKLMTGLSMEAMWQKLRPDPIADQATLEQVMELERLADRFDELKWRVDVDISTLRTVQDSMARIYAVIRTGKVDAASLVKDLQTEISTLEAKIGEHSGTHQPFFATSFEGLRQAGVLHNISKGIEIGQGSSDVDVLSSLPTAALMRIQCMKQTDLQGVDCILAQESETHPWEGQLSKALLRKYDAASSASLGQLRSLEVEMPIMGRALAAASEALATDPLEKAERLLLRLMDEVLSAHDESRKGAVAVLYESLLKGARLEAVQLEELGQWLEQSEQLQIPEGQWPMHVVETFKSHFAKSLLALVAAAKGLQPRSAFTSIAWVRFALGCVTLFVPDKIFDPHHRAQIEAEEHNELYSGLQKEIAALEAFEVAFTGQKTSIRSQTLVEEAGGLGEPPAVESIYRPGGGELRSLQGEFNNVLNALLTNDVATTHLKSIMSSSTEVTEELSLVEQNVSLLIHRLTSRFGAYQDLTMPLVSFLRCLKMGLSLGRGVVPASPSTEDNEDEDTKSELLVSVTPFLQGTVYRAETEDLPLRNFAFLYFIQTVATVEGRDQLPQSMRKQLFESLAIIHEVYSKRFEEDKRKEVEASGLSYVHKGSLEDEKEYDQKEFDSLFPDYYAEDKEDDDKPKVKKPKKSKYSGKDLAVMLAEAHEKIFLASQEPQVMIKELCTQVARTVARSKGGQSGPEMDAVLLPATLLVFEDSVKAFSAGVESGNYNFYTDAHLAEVRKVLGLVNAIRNRFLELQGIDEIGHHQTLADVILACDKVLEMAIDDPLAKIITAIEKLHAHVYEWHEGGWATAANKAVALYEKLRDTICDWRRLELSSWSRLLDVEVKRFHDEAKAFWFDAYNDVILKSCVFLEEGLLKEYAVELLETLSKYFTGDRCTVGQFKARLELLKQLKSQLDLLSKDEAQFGVIGDAVQNSIAYYGRYLGKVEEFIKSGRQPLDRTMKDVLLMGKWRDKNIEALRASARKSHEKLFKLVRKFRAVLEQPIRIITDQGLPEEKHEGAGMQFVKVADHSVDATALDLCQKMVPGIETHPQWSRMVNLPGVLRAMGKHGSLPVGVVGATSTVDEYITDLVSSIAELRKETPSTLTDENKEAVRHLKTRKVTLYSETLKTLRAMGFSRNLGTNILDKQSSTQKVLVGSGLIPHLSGPDLDALEYFYHKTLDLAPKVRKAANDHNEDLNREVVGRSIGFFEGVLHVMFKQRQFLSKTAHADRALEEAIAYVRQLSIGGEGSFTPETKQTNCTQVLKWLVQIVKFGVHLVEVHGKLGQIDNEAVKTKLGGWVETFAKLEKVQQNLPALPEGFVSLPQEALQVDVERELAALKVDLVVLAQERPDLAFVMEQVDLWTDIQATSEITNGLQHEGIDTFANSALTLSSKILVALQNFQKTAQTLPATTEDPSWLVTYGETLQKSIDALRMPTITADITSLISQLRSLPSPSTATPILRLVLPILTQYSTSCLSNISKFTSLHRTLCRLGYTLSSTFTIISTQGFCQPQEESNEKSNETGNVENDGTGLGDGEGAEDISKDIQPDEDLTELAQDKNNNTQNDIEEHDDAVDMGDDELEGELGDVAAKDEEEDDKDKDGSDDEEDDEMDEQAGDVDDLDPTAVDEKMWDGSGEDDAEKDQQGEGEKGEKDESDTVAAEEKKDDKKKKEEESKGEQSNEKGDDDEENGEDEEEEGEPGDENEGVAMEELNKQDQHVDEQETLALPDDMDVDISDEEGEEEDDLDGLSDVDIDKAEEEEKKGDDVDSDNGDEQEKGEEEHQKDEEIDEAEAEEEEKIDAAGEREEEMDVDEQGDEGKDEEEEKPKPMQDDGGGMDQNDVAPSEVQNGGGQAQDDANDMEQDETDNKAAQRESGAVSKQQAEQDKAPGTEGALSTMDQEQGPSDQPEDDSKQAQPFKKLGDALERWYRNQKDIQAADDQERPEKQAEDMSKAEFQHLQDDTAEADAQALGTATNEEARPMDDAMAIDNEMEEQGQQVLPEDEPLEEEGDVEMEDAEPAAEPQDGIKKDREDGRSGVATHKGAPDNDNKLPGEEPAPDGINDSDIQETSTHLSHTDISSDRPLRPYDEALELWSTFQQKTQPLSQSLSSQLRLILAPTQSTKLSGSFRTGKRLNIKKIIPYIASSYKRDKIWMRRAIPSKRAYQILLCVDDSSSMSDENRSSSGHLALESLVMVARALTILESGQIGVLGFGEDVFVAHSLTDPSFSSHDAGARVLQKFTFASQGTDMVKLLRATIDNFREARLTQASSPGGEDLWQLALILSDGLVQSRDHARLRPLLREAMEQRVMVVFIVMDDVRDKKGHSVLELKEARFGADGMPVVRRYLDSFPFEYYLIVHDLEDLPGALAGVLRGWFAEVNA
ncbi:putative midasin [Triangularia verruculosa]|uniref:Midasin n=1 Tax=Triangularia verruculosa TaxID=2587418 RepID=A0AAN7AVG3_9PEZI|nr:putative midasin [Triangularia verruculosa]